MILQRSIGYWSTGIVVRYDSHNEGWLGTVEYFDDGFLGDDDADTGAVCTEGRLTTRYAVRDGSAVPALTAVVDALIADAAKLGVQFVPSLRPRPGLYYPSDGEDSDWPPPPSWRLLLREQAKRIGWCTYGYEPIISCWALWDGERQELIGQACGYLLETADAAWDSLSDGPADLAWQREHCYLERISVERSESLLDWDAKTEDERAVLRPARGDA